MRHAHHYALRKEWWARFRLRSLSYGGQVALPPYDWLNSFSQDVGLTRHMLCRPPLKVLAWLVGLLCLSAAGADVAHACACDSISPAQGFARTQYVFIGKVLEAKGHTWTIDVDRVWKGADKLAARVRLLDVYKDMDCEFYFEPGRAYIFFAIVAKSSRYVFYQPEVCNWTNALRSKRVKIRSYPVAVESGEELQKGPYVAETFPVHVENSYVIIEM